MAAKTKSKKTVTPLKDVTVPSRLASPLTGEYVYSGDNDGVTDAPYDKSKETTVDDLPPVEIPPETLTYFDVFKRRHDGMFK